MLKIFCQRMDTISLSNLVILLCIMLMFSLSCPENFQMAHSPKRRDLFKCIVEQHVGSWCMKVACDLDLRLLSTQQALIYEHGVKKLNQRPMGHNAHPDVQL